MAAAKRKDVSGELLRLLEQLCEPHGVSEACIEDVEQRLGVHFPGLYREVLRRFGTVKVDSFELYGLGSAAGAQFSVEAAALAVRKKWPVCPPGLVPLELSVDGSLVAMLADGGVSGDGSAPVVLCAPGSADAEVAIWPLAPDFQSYLSMRLLTVRERAMCPAARERGLKRLEWHVRRFHARYGYNHATGGDLPRNHDWRPYRFCVQDVVLGMTVVGHLVDQNCLEVDVFLTADVQEFEAGSGARALTMFLLTEAYKCGGTMEIRFTPNVEGGRVPIALQQLARQLDVPVERGRPATITSEEARRLYLALTPFTPFGRDRVRALAAAGMVSPERACYTVHHGVWSVSEVETLLGVSQHPDRIFAGGASPLHRLAYLEDLHAGRTAILGGLLQVTLSQRVPERPASEQGAANVPVEDDVRPTDLEFEGDLAAQVYRSPKEAISLPWLENERDSYIPAGEQFLVALRGRPACGLALRLTRDLRELALLLRRRSGKSAGRVFVLVPGDFFELPANVQQSLRSAAEKWDVGLLVCPERLACIDAEVSRRFGRSRIMRQ
jgi:hypothetical protein